MTIVEKLGGKFVVVEHFWRVVFVFLLAVINTATTTTTNFFAISNSQTLFSGRKGKLGLTLKWKFFNIFFSLLWECIKILSFFVASLFTFKIWKTLQLNEIRPNYSVLWNDKHTINDNSTNCFERWNRSSDFGFFERRKTATNRSNIL